MSGKQTIGLTLVAFLVLCALGFSVAACVERDDTPPMLPGDPKVHVEPLELADTRLVRLEVFSDDATYRLEQKCRAEGGEPFVRETFVHCEGGGHRNAPWMFAIHDVPEWRRGVK